MDKTRTYAEGCVAAHALDLIGDRWSLLVVRELMLGPRRFSQIRAGLPGVATNILTTRLEGLIQAAVVRRTREGGYALTAAGLDLRGVIDALCRWGARQPGHDPRQWISPAALMQSMRCFCDRARVPAEGLTAGFDMGDDGFVVAVTPGDYRITRDDPGEQALCFAGRSNMLAAAMYGPVTVPQAVACGMITVAGDHPAAQRFVDLFSLPSDGAVQLGAEVDQAFR